MKTHRCHGLSRLRNVFIWAVLATASVGAYRLGVAPSFGASPQVSGGTDPNYSELIDFSSKSGSVTFHLGYSNDTALNTHLEFVPNGESVQRWTQMITVITTKPGHRVAPDQWIASTVGFLQKTCGTVKLAEKRSVNQIDKLRQQQALPAEYPTYSIFAVCENPSQAPAPGVTLHRYEVIWFKGIKGWLNDYLVQRAWHADAITPESILASKATQDEWRNWIDAVAISGRPKSKE